MANRYFVELSYDGTPFHGWQVQKNAKTIQQWLNEALSTVSRREISTIGCGRTDTGVHARRFYAHMDCETPLDDLEGLAYHANRVLPPQIAIHRIFEVRPDDHSRFSAISRTYEYLITTRKDPFAYQRQLELREQFDLEAMNRACVLLKDYEDFTSFSKANSDTETNLCRMHYAYWELTEHGYRFEIKANRFLRNMVRAVVGTLLETGRGKLDLHGFRQIIEAKDRSAAGFSVAAHGLYLIDIEYPEGILQ